MSFDLYLVVAILPACFFLLYCWSNGQLLLGLFFTPTFIFYFFPPLVQDSSLVNGLMEHGSVQSWIIYVAFGITQLMMFSIAVNRRFIVAPIPYDGVRFHYSISFRRLALVYYFLSLLSIMALIINLSKVGFSIGLLFINARQYELTFGSSTITNYLYFLHVPALIVLVELSFRRKIRNLEIVLASILLTGSLLHGIKFTVFDAILLPALYYYFRTSDPKRALAYLIFIALILLVFYLLFDEFIRGTNAGGGILYPIFEYIIPNFVNFAYSIDREPFQLTLFQVLIPDKIPNPFTELLYNGKYGFVLNDKFNMSTGFSAIYSALPVVSWALFLPTLIVLYKLMFNITRKSASFLRLYLVIFLGYGFMFFWYFYSFNKTKLMFYLVVFLLIDAVLKSRGRVRN